MSHLLRIIATLLLLTSAVACQNDGDIGELYGQWQLTEVRSPQGTTKHTTCFFAFQSDVIFGRILTDHHYADTMEGVWKHTGDSLLLTFYVNDGNRETLERYLLHDFGMEGDPADQRFGIGRLDGSQMILHRNGDTFWTFRKF